jgi:hypothetical protein
MTLARILNTLILPGVVWLLLGAPSLTITGNAVLFAVVVAHLLVVIWNEAIFRLFRGDAFTYGLYSLAMNLLSFAVTFAIALVVLLLHDGRLGSAGDIPAFAWGFMVLGVIGTVFLPLLASHKVSRLPQAGDARPYEGPPDERLPR